MNTLKMRTVNYFNARARVADVRVRGQQFVAITEWLDDADERNGGHPAGTVVARHLSGDGRRLDTVILAEETFSDVDAAVAWAIDRRAQVTR